MTVNNLFQVYNKACGKLTEVQNNSVDFIVTSPPYNIGHHYLEPNKHHDHIDPGLYFGVLKNFICGAADKLKGAGICVIDIASHINIRGLNWRPVDFLTNEFSKYGFHLTDAKPYGISYERKLFYSEEPTNKHGVLEKNSDFHAPTQCLLAFSRDPNYCIPKKQTLKDFYDYSISQNSAYWPMGLVIDLLYSFQIEKGKVLLDPFMGSGMIGLIAITCRAFFYGYEIENKAYQDFLQKAKIQ